MKKPRSWGAAYRGQWRRAINENSIDEAQLAFAMGARQNAVEPCFLSYEAMDTMSQMISALKLEWYWRKKKFNKSIGDRSEE